MGIKEKDISNRECRVREMREKLDKIREEHYGCKIEEMDMVRRCSYTSDMFHLFKCSEWMDMDYIAHRAWFNEENLTIEIDTGIPGYIYEIDLEECDSARALVGWIYQLMSKYWGREIISDFLWEFNRAMRVIFAVNAQVVVNKRWYWRSGCMDTMVEELERL